jgi:hypothetical protein
MAFGGSAIFSNDPNIGIRQMGLEHLIPPPLTTMTRKGRGEVDARRRRAYVNAPSKPAMREGATSAKPQRVKLEEQKRQQQRQQAGQRVSEMLDPTKRAASAMRSRAAAPPMVAAPTMSLAKQADNIVDFKPDAGLPILPSAAFGEPEQYRTQSGGIYNTLSPIESMNPQSRARYEKRRKMTETGATDLPEMRMSRMFA